MLSISGKQAVPRRCSRVSARYTAATARVRTDHSAGSARASTGRTAGRAGRIAAMGQVSLDSSPVRSNSTRVPDGVSVESLTRESRTL